MIKTISALMVAVSAVAFSANAKAELEYTPYVGVDYVNSSISGENFHNAAINLGTKYNKYFSTEVFYQTPLESTKFSDEGYKMKASYRSYGLDAYGYLPLGCDQVVSILGTAGIGQVDVKSKEIGGEHGKDNGWAYRLGAGVQYDVTEAWAVRAVARYSFLDKLDGLDHAMDFTAGVRYSF